VRTEANGAGGAPRCCKFVELSTASGDPSRGRTSPLESPPNFMWTMRLSESDPIDGSVCMVSRVK
jgi:hypothetical protein